MFQASRSFLQRLVRNYGYRFCVYLTSVYFGLKGPVYQMIVSGQLPYFKSIGVSGELYQSYGTVASTPWAMKAAIGILSDAVPVLGWHKRPYMLIASVMGSASLVVLAAVQMQHSTAPLAAFLLMCVSLQLAVVDLLSEGTYAAQMATKPETGADVVSYVWGLYMLGTFLGSSVSGPVADHFNPRGIFWVCLPLALQVILSTFFLPEDRLPPGRRGFRTDKIREFPLIFLLGLCMTAGAMILAGVALFAGSVAQSMVSVALSLVLCILACIWLPPILARGNLYMFLASALYVNIGGASDYWFTAQPACVPGGPHFSFTYYITYASVVGSLAGMLGVALFQTFLSRGTYRTAFCSTLLLKLVASMFDLFIVNRKNIQFGIPDKLAFMLGDAIIFQVAAMLDFMPAVVLTASSCPKGMEATVYALLAGFQNFGSNVARALGVGLLSHLKIETTEPCNFEKLPHAIVIAHVILPLITVPLIFILIPDRLMTEKLLPSEDDGEGSAFELGEDDEFDDSDDLLQSSKADQDLNEAPLIRAESQAIDMELDSIYAGDSEESSAGNSLRTAASFPSTFTPSSFQNEYRLDQPDG